jgi:hypothetical protein
MGINIMTTRIEAIRIVDTLTKTEIFKKFDMNNPDHEPIFTELCSRYNLPVDRPIQKYQSTPNDY